MENGLAQFNLDGRTALVTGASRGIGKSIAALLAEAGASVIVSSRNQEAVDQVAEELKDKGLSAKAKACHVGKAEELKQLVNFTAEAFGGIDILVNNAATNPYFGPIETMSEELFDKIMNVNVKAAFSLSNLCYPHFKSKGKASIINIASVEGFRPSPGLSVYSVSKAALLMLTKSQAKEWGKDNIRSNSICPGLIKTKFSQAIWANDAFLKNFTKHIPSGRIAEAEEMAGLALFLASDASSYCTGAAFTADGGYLI